MKGADSQRVGALRRFGERMGPPGRQKPSLGAVRLRLGRSAPAGAAIAAVEGVRDGGEADTHPIDSRRRLGSRSGGSLRGAFPIRSIVWIRRLLTGCSHPAPESRFRLRFA